MKLKKVIFLIIALILVVLGISIKEFYFNDNKKNVNVVNQISEEEIESEDTNIATELERLNIKKYLESIYGDYVAIPEFTDINQADEKWLWENVRSNITTDEKTSYTYKELSDKTKELYGSTLTKQFPKEGSEFMVYNEKTDNYIAGDFSLEIKEWFVLRKIKKIDNVYYVEIIEYTKDVQAGDSDNPTAKMNLLDYKENIIKTYDVPEDNKEKEVLENQIQEYVLNNEKRFSKKSIVLQLDKKINALYIKSCIAE